MTHFAQTPSQTHIGRFLDAFRTSRVLLRVLLRISFERFQDVFTTGLGHV